MRIFVENTNNDVNFFNVSNLDIDKLKALYLKSNMQIKAIFKYDRRTEDEFVGLKQVYPK